MSKRRYAQRCALARTLDLVGERWTLLVVRELLCGTRRYGELLEGLPGMGTNLLAARLRELERVGLVERDGRSYALTPRGAELEPAVIALARFGAPLLSEGEAGDLWLARWNVLALKYAFRPERARSLNGVVEYVVDGTTVQARFKDGALETAGERRWKPDTVVRADGPTLLALAAADLDPADAEADGRLAVEGDRRIFRRSLRAFELA